MRSFQILEFNSSNKALSTLILFCLPLFFLILADSTMSYMFPILTEGFSGSNAVLGLIMALSSIVGVIADFVLPQLIKQKTWKFQLYTAIFLAIIFPLTTYLGVVFGLFIFFIIASMFWGLYYEFITFSEQSFIVTEDRPVNYSKDWGILFIIFQLTAITGPIIGAYLLHQSFLVSTFTIIFFQLLSFIFLSLIAGRISHQQRSEKYNVASTLKLLSEIRYWEVIGVKIWPAIVMGISINIINATFWTIGGLFGETLFPKLGLEWLIIVLYSGPMIIGSLILAKLKVKKGKKRLSQISLLSGGFVLALLPLFKDSSPSILILIVTSSLLFAFAQPLNEAVYSDLLFRMGKGKLHLLGIARANASIAYIIGPIFAGIVADKTDYFSTFSIIGILAVIISILLLIFTPKRLKLPQKALEEMNKLN